MWRLGTVHPAQRVGRCLGCVLDVSPEAWVFKDREAETQGGKKWLGVGWDGGSVKTE